MIWVLAASLREEEGFNIIVFPFLRREILPPFKNHQLCGIFLPEGGKRSSLRPCGSLKKRFKSGQRNTLVFDDLDKGFVVKTLTFECDLRIGGGKGQPAEGFSLNYVRADDPLASNGSQFAGTDGETNLPEEGS